MLNAEWPKAVLAPLVIAVALTGCSGSVTSQEASRGPAGGVREPGTVDVAALQVGDCINEPSLASPDAAATDITDLQAVPCSQPHTAEVVAVDAAFFGAAGEFPGDEQISVAASDGCVAQLERYAGIDHPDGELDVIALYPTAQSWAEADDRGLACLGIRLNDDGSAAAAATGTIRAR